MSDAQVISTDIVSAPDVHLSLKLAEELYSQFANTRQIPHLSSAVDAARRAVESTAGGCDERWECLNLLAYFLSERFHCLGDNADMEESVVAWREAVRVIPANNIGKPSLLSNLGCALQTRYEQRGELQDLQDAISLLARAVELAPANSSHRPGHLANLSDALCTRFDRLRDLQDVEDAFAAITRSNMLTPDAHPSKPGRLMTLGRVLHTRFDCLGDAKDLEDAIVARKRALELMPDGHPQKPVWLSGLGSVLQARFDRFGNLEDLEYAITAHIHANSLMTDRHPDKPKLLNSLGSALQARYERLGNMKDLEGTIVATKQAIKLVPDHYPETPGLLTNLGNALEARFNRLDDLQDLEDAIEAKTRAIGLIPDDHPNLRGLLTNLANGLIRRFECLENLKDLEESITVLTRALELTPDSHSDKMIILTNLGHALQTRFSRVGELQDLEKAIIVYTRVIDLTPTPNPKRVMPLFSLGRVLLMRLKLQRVGSGDVNIPIEIFKQAAQETAGNPSMRLRAGVEVVNLLSHPLSESSQEQLLEAHELVLDLVPRVAWLGHDVHRRFEELVTLGTLASRAAADAIAAGEYGRALRWLESGRSIVWAQVLQLRTPLDNLRQEHPSLASDFERVSQALQNISLEANILEDSLPVSPATESNFIDSFSETKTQYGLAIEHEKLIEQIRKLDGFEGFLRPKTLAQLIPAATSRPVVVINVHESRCDALILCTSGDVIHVPLPEFSYQRAEKLQEQLLDNLRRAGVRNRFRDDGEDENDAARYFKQTQRAKVISVEHILAVLWKTVVKPIIDVIYRMLAYDSTVGSRLPHVVWCPTGPLVFLPLHAAGIYSEDKPEQTVTVMDFVVSSYTPTLEALLKPRLPTRSADEVPDVLVVAQPYTPGFSAIPKAIEEAKLVHSLFPQTARILEQSAGTVDAVLRAMEEFSWIHLACHGIQHPEDPTKSAFALHDGRLELSALMAKSLPHAELAFLSACQTATGDTTLPEEAVHLAAGMLSVGYKSVVGTMWSIRDSVAPLVAEKFYQVLLEQMAAGDVLEPARALHEATKMLRGRIDEMDFLSWVPFVHFGV